MASLQEIRSKYPQYNDMSDEQFADAFHSKFYSDMPREEFNKRLGISSAPPAESAESVLQRTTRGGAIGGALRQAAQGVTFGAADEIASGLTAAATAPFSDQTFSQIYDRELAANREADKAMQEAHPYVSTGATIGGALLPMIATGGASAPASLGAATLRGAGTGAAYGGITGFMSGEGGAENRLVSGGTGAALGGTIGAAIPGGAKLVGKAVNAVMGRGAQPVTAGVTNALKAASTAQYKAADAAGLVVSKNATSKFAKSLADDLAREGIDADLQAGATKALARITDASGKDLSLAELDILRKVARAAKESNPSNASNRRLSNIIIDKIDDFVDNLKPQDVAAGDAKLAASSINQARELWKRAIKSEAVERQIEKAQKQASKGGSGGNIDNAIRQRLDELLNSPKFSRMWTAEEKGMIQSVVKGKRMENLARLVGKLSPQGNGLMLALQAGAAGFSGGTSLPVAGAGFVAKRFADSARQKGAQQLLQAIQAGKVPPTVISKLPPEMQNAIQALIAGGSTAAGRGVGAGLSAQPQPVQ